MKFLLTNDDGIDAPGLAALRQAAQSLGECVTVAPRGHYSGCSHQATVDRPLVLDPRSDQTYSLNGYPVDCTRLGLMVLAPDFDWIISGINEGGNLGHDVHLSGTVAAVREAAIFGKPGIALSQYRRRAQPVRWERAARWARRVLAALLQQPLPKGAFFNVNFPDPDEDTEPDWQFCPLDPHPLPMTFEPSEAGHHYRSNYHARNRHPEHDVDVCFRGGIAVTQLQL